MEDEMIDVAIIGAGMAGLSAAVYARLSGLKVKVFEQHYLPGGLCTAWERKGYIFDYCVDYIMGSRKGQGFYSLWKDLGVIEKTQFRHIDSFGRYQGADNQILNLYTDYRRLRQELLAIAPEDAAAINQFCKAIRKARNFMMVEFTPSMRGLFQVLRSLPALFTMQKWAAISTRGWCAGFRNTFLREAIPALIGMTDVPMSGPILVFGMMSKDLCAYPLGGSLPIALAAEQRAKSLGAQIIYHTKANRIILEQNRVAGVAFEDGGVQRAHHVVAACDARFIFETLLEGKIKDAAYEELFQKKEIHPCIVQVSLGLRLKESWELTSMPKRVNLPLSNPIVVDQRKHDRLSIYQYSKDPWMAEPGGTVLIVQFEADYDWWQSLRADSKAYRAEKDRIQSETIKALDGHFPGLASAVETSDVATPSSCERYTGNWRGSTQGWINSTELLVKQLSGFRLPKTFDAAKNFYMIGQWTEIGGGLPPSIRSGRDVVRMIMKSKREKRGN